MHNFFRLYNIKWGYEKNTTNKEVKNKPYVKDYRTVNIIPPAHNRKKVTAT